MRIVSGLFSRQMERTVRLVDLLEPDQGNPCIKGVYTVEYCQRACFI